MNKKLVNELIPLAYQELDSVGIAQNGEISKGFRGQIASFGAAIATGSLLAASAFFNDQGGSKSERHKLMVAINNMLAYKDMENGCLVQNQGNTLFDTVKIWMKAHNGSGREIKEKVLSCAIALKLAMNLYSLKPEKKNKKG